MSLSLPDCELLTYLLPCPSFLMHEPLCGHLVPRGQKVDTVEREVFVCMICVAHYCEVLISSSYFGNGYFAPIQTTLIR